MKRHNLTANKRVNIFVYLYRFVRGKMLCRHFSMVSVYCRDCAVFGYQYRDCVVVKNRGWKGL